MSKIIFLDYGYYMFKSIFSWEKRQETKATYTATTMILGDLRKVGVDENDIVIIAVDSPKGSWRKEFDSAYKANRKEKREEHTAIDWKKQFNDFNGLVLNFDMYTPFHVICIDKLEADDIIAYGCKKFSDKECIAISSDTDYEQLTAYPNVKLFSPITKKYKKIENPYSLIHSKIQKETTDNLVSEILSEADYMKRYKLVCLLDLPEFVIKQVDEKLNFLPEKEWMYDYLLFPSLIDRYKNIYLKDKVVPFEKPPRKKRIKSELKRTT